MSLILDVFSDELHGQIPKVSHGYNFVKLFEIWAGHVAENIDSSSRNSFLNSKLKLHQVWKLR